MLIAMKPVVVEVGFMLVLGFFFRKSKCDDINFISSCNKWSNMFVTCSYNGKEILAGFKLHVDGLFCGTFKHTSDGSCVKTSVEHCTDFTHTCPDYNTITLTVKDIMIYAERENGQNLTCQPFINNKATSEKTFYLRVHPTLDTRIGIKNNISTKREENIHLQIKVVALPLPSFTWFQKSGDNWHSISSYANKNVTSTKLESKLTIFRVLPTDEGWYKVRAENDCGEVEQQYHVHVEVPEKDSELIDPMFVRIVVPVAVVVLLVGVAAVVIVCVRWKNGGQREANRQESSADPERTYQPLNHTNIGPSSIYNALELNVYANDDW